LFDVDGAFGRRFALKWADMRQVCS